MLRESIVRRAFACLMVLAPVSAAAQVKLEAAPFFASYYATTNTANPGPDTTERQEAGPGLGVHVNYRFSNVVGVQGTFAYVVSGIIPKYPPSTGLVSNSNQPLPGNISFAMIRGTLQPRRSNYYLAAGLGTVTRGGRAWDVPDIDHLTNTMVSLGFGIRARVTPEFAFNIGIDANLYMSDPDGPEQGGARRYYQRRMQRDVLVTIGIPKALIGR
jgi:hypothetical protein